MDEEMTEPSAVISLRKQLQCYRTLLKLSDQQREFVQQNQTDELLVVLQHRGELLQEITQLEVDVAPLKKTWEQQSQLMNDEVRKQAQEMLAETRLLLEQITSADQDDVLVLQQRKIAVGKQLQVTSNARVLNKNYAASAYGIRSHSNLNVKQ